MQRLPSTFPSGRVLAACMLSAMAVPATAALDTRVVADGLNLPVQVVQPFDDGRLYVVGKNGSITLTRPGNSGPGHTVLSLDVRTDGEQGLLGLAFDPRFMDGAAPGHRRIYVDYIDRDSGDTVVASWQLNASGRKALPSTRREILRIAQPPYPNHKGGWIGFQPGNADDLYIATGDGGSGYDPGNRAQDPSSLLGKMLRVDVHRDDFADPDVNYGVPQNNPFVGQAGTRPEIYALGLRNPWRNGFDRATGDLWIADVGQDLREEIDVIRAGGPGGQNFGWRLREGDVPTPGIGDPPVDGLTGPWLSYTHAEGSSIIGGPVVRNPGSWLDGKLVFGDYVTGRVWAVDASLPGATLAQATELTGIVQGGGAGVISGLAAINEGSSGQLYLVDLDGRIVRVVPEPSTAVLALLGLVGLVAALHRRGRGREDGRPAPEAPSTRP